MHFSYPCMYDATPFPYTGRLMITPIFPSSFRMGSMRLGIRAFSPSMSRATDGTKVGAPADKGGFGLGVACFALFLLLAIRNSAPVQLYLFCASDTFVYHLSQPSLDEFALTNAQGEASRLLSAIPPQSRALATL